MHYVIYSTLWGVKRGSTPLAGYLVNHLFTCNTDLRMGEEGSTVHTKRPLSQPTTNTEPDNGLKWKKKVNVTCHK